MPEGSSRWLGSVRLGVGLAQGVALYGLTTFVQGSEVHPWAAANPMSLGLLALLAVVVPMLLLLSIGHLRAWVLAGWMTVVVTLVAGLGLYDMRQNGDPDFPMPGFHLVITLGALLFVGQALVAAWDAGNRRANLRIPLYTDLFEASWRAALQLVQAVGFVGSFWVVFWIGNLMFQTIGIEVLQRLGGRLDFVLPVSCTLTAVAIHAADAQEGLARGLRRAALGLEAWLTPMLAGLATAFVLSLPFTGLAPLWARDLATLSLMAAAALMVLLINAVHQDGREKPPTVLGLSARLGGVVLVPLVALAGWGLAIRIGEYGWTELRVGGAMAIVLLGLYALGYALAALRPGMQLLEPVNVAVAAAAVVVLVLVNTAVADPVRLSVMSQVDRLERGEIAPEQFDFHWLARAGRDGRRAQAALVRSQDAVIAQRARDEVRPGREAEAPIPEVAASPRIVALPEGTSLPPGLEAAMAALAAVPPDCVEVACVTRKLSLDGRPVWMVGPVDGGFWAMEFQGQEWRRLAIYRGSHRCREKARESFLAGDVTVVPPRLPEIETGGVRLVPGLLWQDC